MQLNRKKLRLMDQLLSFWVGKGVITEEDSARLRESVGEKKTGWLLVARYSFYCTMCCVFLSVVAILADDKLIAFLLGLFDVPDFARAASLATVGGLILIFGDRLGSSYPHRFYSRESIYFCGAFILAAADWFLGKALNIDSEHYSLLLLLAFLVYCSSGVFLSSKILWLWALVSLFWAFLNGTEHQSGDSLLFYGMNIPIRFSLWSVMILLFSYLLPLSQRTILFYPITKVFALVSLFLSLWGVAVFGNNADWDSWGDISQFELWQWNLPLVICCMTSIWVGSKWDDSTYRHFGISFFLLLLYTMYFEYVWDSVHGTVFFALLGCSFWLLGRFSESIWMRRS